MRYIASSLIIVAACSRSTPPAPDTAAATATSAPSADADAAPTTPAATAPVVEADAQAAPPSDVPAPAHPPAVALQPAVQLPLPLRAHELQLAALSPDGTRLAVAYPDNVALFDAATGAALWSVASEGPTYVAFSPSGKTLWVLALGGLSRLDTATGRSDWSAEGSPFEQVFVPTSDEGGLAFGAPSVVVTVPDGVRAFTLDEAIAEAGFDASMADFARCDPASGRVALGSPTHALVLDRSGRKVLFAPRPETLGEDGVGESVPGPTLDTRVAAQDGEALLIDAKTWRRKAVVTLPTEADGAIIGDWTVGAVHPKGPRAAILGPNETVVVDFGAKKVVSKVPRTLERDVWPTFFSPDGSELWTLDNEPARWRLDPEATPLLVTDGDPDLLAGELIVVLGDHGMIAQRLDGAPAWSASTPGDVTWDGGALGGGRVARVVRSSDDNLPVTGVQLVDAASGALQARLAAPSPLVADDVAVALDAARVVLVANDRIVVWALPDGAPIETPIARGRARVASTAGALVVRDGKLEAFVIGAEGKPTEARAVALSIPAEAPMTVVGGTGVVAVEGALHVIELATGQVVRALAIDTPSPTELSVDDALERVVVRTAGDQARVHDARTGARLFNLEAPEPTFDAVITPDGARVVSAGRQLRVHALGAPTPGASGKDDGDLAPLLRPQKALRHRWSAVSTVVDVDTGKETKTPSRGEGTCTIERVEAALTLDCEDVRVESDYEVNLPARFERRGELVEIDRDARIPLTPRTTTHVVVERGADEAVEVVASRRFRQEGDTWCLEVAQGTAHPGVERLCFFAAGGLASYASEQGSAAMGLEFRIEFEGPHGFQPRVPPE